MASKNSSASPSTRKVPKRLVALPGWVLGGNANSLAGVKASL